MSYLDNAATTPLRPEALEAMLPYLTERFGNPSGAHVLAREARRAVETARETVAGVLGCAPGEVVFTSGGTEADNAAIGDDGVVVCSAIEHHAVLDPARMLGARIVPVRSDGTIDLDALRAMLDDSVRLVSVMLVNNEVGVVQPLDEVSALARSAAPGATVHTDAVQALPWLDVGVSAATADLVSVSAHKIGGPKGVGALVVREGTPFRARQVGGGQERERRGGTQNVAGIVGFAEAARLAHAERTGVLDRLRPLRERLTDGLLAAIPEAVETSPRAGKVAGFCHLCIDGIESEALLLLLEREGVIGSAAASCASGATEPSHVLAALGVPRSRAQGSLRLSLGATSSELDVERALAVIPPAVARLRRSGS